MPVFEEVLTVFTMTGRKEVSKKNSNDSLVGKIDEFMETVVVMKTKGQ